MSSVEDWQPGVLSGKPELWNWREMWKPCGPSLGNSGQNSGTVVESGQGLLVNSANRTSGSASSWLRWDGPGPWRDGGCHTGPQLEGQVSGQAGLVTTLDRRMAPLSVPSPGLQDRAGTSAGAGHPSGAMSDSGPGRGRTESEAGESAGRGE